MSNRTPRLAFLLPLTMAGCADTYANAPSLLPRPVESRGDAERVRPAAEVAPDPALEAQVIEQRAALARAAAAFRTSAADAEAKVAVARGVAVGSDAWVRAQTALSELDVVQADTMAVVSAVEALAIARAADGKSAHPALDALLAEAQAAGQAQAAKIRSMSEALPAA